MMVAPSGTVTFLFTDIEGSTRRWERDRAAMADALERHDRMLRGIIEAHNGYVFKTVGDAFCCAFGSAGDAAEAALAVQRELAGQDFRAVDGLTVRIAIHSGSASERGGDYFGPTVNRVARLLAIAHGGQILLSGTATELIRERQPEGSTLLDLGDHVLKDLGRPERVHQLSAPGLRAAFPALRSIGVIPNNLPEFGSTFVGRASEVEAISHELASARGLTLCGTGGIGKTRCAVQVGRERSAQFPQGVWLVELSSITSGENVAATIATAIGTSASSDGRAALDDLCSQLKTQNALLVLDNCEHLVEHVAPVVETLLRRCPNLHSLATSREPLGYRGERVYRLPALAIPPDASNATVDAARDYDAVNLFVTRAAEADPRFRLTPDNVSEVVAICRRLDGIALGIELAAKRLRVMSLEQLADGLRERFRLLAGGSRTALPHQRTMRALIDWSYDLLDERERRVFSGLSVFAGSFTLEACAAVCRQEGESDYDILDTLGSLVDKSLVAAPASESAQGPARLRLIETLREYAGERLAERDDAGTRLALFEKWALGLADAAHAQWVSSATDDWEARYTPEIENVRAAVEVALERDASPVEGARIAARARRMFGALSPAEGMRLVELARRGGDVPPEVSAELLLAHAQMNIAVRRPAAALASARVAAEAFERAGTDEFAHEAQIVSGYAYALLGRATNAKSELRAAQAYFSKEGALQFCGVIASDLGVTHVSCEEFDEAHASYDEALRCFRRTNNKRGIRAVVTNLAELDFRAGDVEAAIERIFAELSQGGGADALMLGNLAAYLTAADRFEQALEYARESLIEADASNRNGDILFALQHVAAALALREDAERTQDASAVAARIVGFVDAQLGEIASAREFTERQEYDRLVAALERRFDSRTLESLIAEGASWDDRSAITAALHT
jgi:predicted ATPase/class 3 adenylate cyclase/tetratricopeptide (TPR) repeat protein